LLVDHATKSVASRLLLLRVGLTTLLGFKLQSAASLVGPSSRRALRVIQWTTGDPLHGPPPVGISPSVVPECVRDSSSRRAWQSEFGRVRVRRQSNRWRTPNIHRVDVLKAPGLSSTALLRSWVWRNRRVVAMGGSPPFVACLVKHSKIQPLGSFQRLPPAFMPHLLQASNGNFLRD
jgi:hypothetical protein